MYNVRAKIIKGSEYVWFVKVMPCSGIYCSREIAIGSLGTLNNRAKVGVCSVMLVYSRKIVYRYAGMYVSRSEDHYEPF
jgi:hypothetical protein